ncbi:hypothetical protein [Blattabacterium sp. (Cryptocercus kyebangensis)]|nr:hypothetical protein [Blattabacterium sp. (Cryptocercus kyebangensis)]
MFFVFYPMKIIQLVKPFIRKNGLSIFSSSKESLYNLTEVLSEKFKE